MHFSSRHHPMLCVRVEKVLNRSSRTWQSDGRLNGLERRQQTGVDGLAARRARERPHQPVVDTVHVILVHARQVSNAVA